MSSIGKEPGAFQAKVQNRPNDRDVQIQGKLAQADRSKDGKRPCRVWNVGKETGVIKSVFCKDWITKMISVDQKERVVVTKVQSKNILN